jgi:hypothetical protein
MAAHHLDSKLRFSQELSSEVCSFRNTNNAFLDPSKGSFCSKDHSAPNGVLKTVSSNRIQKVTRLQKIRQIKNINGPDASSSVASEESPGQNAKPSRTNYINQVVPWSLAT